MLLNVLSHGVAPPHALDVACRLLPHVLVVALGRTQSVSVLNRTSCCLLLEVHLPQNGLVVTLEASHIVGVRWCGNANQGGGCRYILCEQEKHTAAVAAAAAAAAEQQKQKQQKQKQQQQ